MNDKDEENIHSLIQQVRQNTARIDRLEEQMIAHNTMSEEIKGKIDALTRSTQDVVEIIAEGRAAFKFFNRVSAAIMWFGKFLVLPAFVSFALYHAATHNGELPGWTRFFDLFRR